MWEVRSRWSSSAKLSPSISTILWSENLKLRESWQQRTNFSNAVWSPALFLALLLALKHWVLVDLQWFHSSFAASVLVGLLLLYLARDSDSCLSLLCLPPLWLWRSCDSWGRCMTIGWSGSFLAISSAVSLYLHDIHDSLRIFLVFMKRLHSSYLSDSKWLSNPPWIYLGHCDIPLRIFKDCWHSRINSMAIWLFCSTIKNVINYLLATYVASYQSSAACHRRKIKIKNISPHYHRYYHLLLLSSLILFITAYYSCLLYKGGKGKKGKHSLTICFICYFLYFLYWLICYICCLLY